MTKKALKEVIEQFEGTLDYIKSLDPIPFYVKREMAEAAAMAAKSHLDAYLKK